MASTGARGAGVLCAGVVCVQLTFGCAQGVSDDAWNASRSLGSAAVQAGAGAAGPPSVPASAVAMPVAPPPVTATAGGGGSAPVSPAAGKGGVSGSPGAGGAEAGAAGTDAAGTGGAGTAGASGTTGDTAPLPPPEDDDDAPTASTGCTAESLNAGDQTVLLDFARARRVYLAHLPPQKANASTPRPLLVVMHAWTQTAAGARAAFGLNASADTEGFVAVYPQGLGNSWNAGGCCGGNAEDSVAFIRTVVEDVAAKSCIDRRRIYASGMANGGMMSFRLACEAADLFAASAPVAGDVRIPACDPQRPIALLAINGTADPLVPYSGAVASVDSLRDRFHCQADASLQMFTPDRCETYGGCDACIEITHCTDLGGRHVWPSGPGLAANPVIWQFLSRFRLPAPAP